MNPRWLARISTFSLFLTLSATALPPVIDDQHLLENLKNSTGDAAGKDGIPSADDLAAKAKTANRQHPSIPLPQPVADAPQNSYEGLSKAVYLIGTVYKCGKCNNWHQGGSATAWCISPDGLMISNAHVFRGAKGAAMGVTDREGKCHLVTELLGWDIDTDVAVFRVKADGLASLKMGASAEVGSPVTVISNPEGNLFLRTSGSVARYAMRAPGPKKPKVVWMNVTADYAKGSSGGPVFNDAGEVVGMVSSTHSIYTGSGPGQAKGNPKGELQMVIRNCVPADSIRALFENPPQAEKPGENG